MFRQIRWGRVFGAVSAVGLLGYGTSWLLESKPGVENQMWLERLPRSPQDKVLYLMFAARDDSAERIGLVQEASVWERRMELFIYGLVRDKARLVFPQDGRAVVLTLKPYDCEGRAPEPFTMCLDVADERGNALTLYSNEELRFATVDNLPALPFDEDAAERPTGLLEMLD